MHAGVALQTVTPPIREDGAVNGYAVFRAMTCCRWPGFDLSSRNLFGYSDIASAGDTHVNL